MMLPYFEYMSIEQSLAYLDNYPDGKIGSKRTSARLRKNLWKYWVSLAHEGYPKAVSWAKYLYWWENFSTYAVIKALDYNSITNDTLVWTNSW